MEQDLVRQKKRLGFLFKRGGLTMSRGREQGVHLEGCYCGQLMVV